MPLKGKNALVTGGTGALGSVIVRRFESEGIRVARTEPRNATGGGQKGTDHFTADVTREGDVGILFEAARKRLGSIDIVVNTVGGFVPSKPLKDVSVEEWDLMMNINLKSSFLCTREALRWMEHQEYGRIINISAMVGLQPVPGRIPYGISKAGVALLTELAAREVRGTGITVNAIAPSIIATEANKRSMPGEDFRKWVTPESIADIICYLCTDQARSITGTTLKAYGGL